MGWWESRGGEGGVGIVGRSVVGAMVGVGIMVGVDVTRGRLWASSSSVAGFGEIPARLRALGRFQLGCGLVSGRFQLGCGLWADSSSVLGL